MDPVLFVNNSYFYPPYRGDSARILRMIEFLQEVGVTVDVLYCRYSCEADRADCAGMKSRCRNYWEYIPTAKEERGGIGPDPDSWCPQGLLPVLSTICLNAEERYRAVIVQHCYYSLCLTVVCGRTLKIIDTHDVFTGRRERVGALEREYTWFTTTREEEMRALERADVVLAIQSSDHKTLREMLPTKRVALVPHGQAIVWAGNARSKRVFFVGNGYAENIQGIGEFIEQGWPRVLDAIPEAELWIAGSVCSALEKVTAGSRVQLLGEVSDVDAFYAQCSIVINTTRRGTGLKIKSVDAMCHGKCLVSTLSGIEGIEGAQRCTCCAETPMEFAECIKSLLLDCERIALYESLAFEMARQLFAPERAFEPLVQVLRE